MIKKKKTYAKSERGGRKKERKKEKIEIREGRRRK